MSDTQKNKKPNVPNLSVKREQKELQIHSAERETNVGRNVPNLRFPGFSGEWACEKLSVFAPDISSGKSKHSAGVFPLIGSTGVIGTTDKPFYNGKMVLVARVGANAGKINYYDGECGITDNTLIVKPVDQSQVICRYIFHYLHHCNLGHFVFGSGQPLITGGMLKRIPIYFGNREEIKRITSLLDKLDQSIAIQNKVIEHYESLIKALAYETIGKYTPNTLLSECVRCSSSALKESDLAEEGAVPAYGAAGISGFTDSALSDGDSILITKDGSGIGAMRYVHGPHSFVGTLNSLTARKGIYLPYVYYSLFNVNFATYKTGQAIPHIYFRDYGKESLYCPSFEGQKKLSKPLELLNLKIENEIALQYILQNVKTYLLSTLFI